ncbi:MAG TPA: FAD-dependent monooxygenase [Microvirga sp.]|nr:FAD-dependent monooxygenase [Microvirga sp.]
MEALSIGVVGAGIGGLAAALVLARQGHAVTLIERRGGFTEVGAGLQLSPNASRVLIGLGLGPALRRVASEPDRVVVRDARAGETIATVALGAFVRERFGAPFWVVHRADLQTVLLDAVRSEPRVRLVMGRKVDTIAQTPRAVSLTLTTASGQTEPAFDAVVGADGVWSEMRRAVGDHRPAAYRGYVAWRAAIPRERAPPELAANETGLWLGRSGHVVHYPVAGGRLLNIVAIERRADPVEGWSTPGDRATLLARFAQAAPRLRDLLAAPDGWLLWPLYDHPARRLAKGRIALVGDAGHPVLPFLAQGAALAIEDAAALARSLSGHAAPEEALRAYERERLPRVRRVQRAARRNGRIYHAGALIAAARNAVMRRLGPQGMATRYAWLYGYGQP